MHAKIPNEIIGIVFDIAVVKYATKFVNEVEIIAFVAFLNVYDNRLT
jgi:hypothetical protein